LIAGKGRWYKAVAREEIHKVAGAGGAICAPGGNRLLDFANEQARWLSFQLPHDYAETLELVFVTLTLMGTMALLVALGRWWQR
jgi:hypothetical protein